MIANSDGFHREVFDSQSTVFESGDFGDAAFVIESGCVEVLVGPPDDLRRVAVLAQGAMFGEVALLDRQARTATVRALVPTKLVRIERTHVDELLLRSDPVIQYLLRILLERFRNSSGRKDLVGDKVRPETDPSQASAQGVDLHAAAVRTLSLARDLSDAIDNNQLVLHYQPIVLLSNMALAGYESLVRWRHPKLGMVSPDEFIPLAERTGMIHRIGHWVLNQAATDWQMLRRHCLNDASNTPFMSVNLSAPEFCAPEIVKNILDCLGLHHMAPQELRIELTETIVIGSLDQASAAMSQMRGQNIGIALDDFGTGYAGLDYLQSLAFSSIKIDKTFVQQIHGSQRSMQIVKSALELAGSLGLSIVAEGIEDEHTGKLLVEMGCTFGQGFHYARPMSLEQVPQWVKSFQE